MHLSAYRNLIGCIIILGNACSSGERWIMVSYLEEHLDTQILHSITVKNFSNMRMTIGSVCNLLHLAQIIVRTGP